MRHDKEEALRLRKLGKSYREIKESLHIPKSTISDWLHKVGWSEKIKRMLQQKAKKESTVRLRALDKIRGERLARIYQEAREEAKKEFESLKWYPLFILGIAIYWGEGEKTTRHLVRIANTDPLMIKCFVAFLVKVCGVTPHKIRAWLLLYPDLQDKTCKDFWISHAGLMRDNFTKSVMIHGKEKNKRLEYGVCSVAVSSTYLKEKMKVWLALMPEEFLKPIYFLRYAGIV